MSFQETIRTVLKEHEDFLIHKRKCKENAKILEDLKDSVSKHKASLKTSGFTYTIVDEELLVNIVDYFFEENSKKYTSRTEGSYVHYSVEHEDIL